MEYSFFSKLPAGMAGIIRVSGWSRKTSSSSVILPSVALCVTGQ